MPKRIALIGAVAAAALVAGVAAAPAQAKVTTQVKGSMTISILSTVRPQLGVAGVQFQALPPATLTDDASRLALTFPAAPPVERGVLRSAGTMAIGAALARIDLAAPYLEYTKKAGVTTGRITFLDEYDAIDGERITMFDVDGMSVKVTKGKVRKAGAVWKRSDLQRITGNVSIVDDPQIVSELNAYIGATWFTPGADFATLSTTVTTTMTCPTPRQCA